MKALHEHNVSRLKEIISRHTAGPAFRWSVRTLPELPGLSLSIPSQIPSS